MNKKEELLLSKTTLRGDKKTLSCLQAMNISNEHDIPLKEIGEMCNSLGIKIVDCELGCFK